LYTSDGSANFMGYSDSKVDKLIARGDRAPSMTAGIRSYQRAEDRVLEDMPVVPLWYETIHAAYSPRLTNVQLDALDHVRVEDVQLS
ncbi:MAG: hypothetical protein ACRDO8_01760, partial [Nocardioidaceae bacterium]